MIHRSASGKNNPEKQILLQAKIVSLLFVFRPSMLRPRNKYMCSACCSVHLFSGLFQPPHPLPFSILKAREFTENQQISTLKDAIFKDYVQSIDLSKVLSGSFLPEADSRIGANTERAGAQSVAKAIRRNACWVKEMVSPPFVRGVRGSSHAGRVAEATSFHPPGAGQHLQAAGRRFHASQDLGYNQPLPQAARRYGCFVHCVERLQSRPDLQA